MNLALLEVSPVVGGNSGHLPLQFGFQLLASANVQVPKDDVNTVIVAVSLHPPRPSNPLTPP
jgi:hypothetical protein